MEFNEKLQELRKQKGITQEELAQALYVSRTAVSKWESGRGYPTIDSLKAIAAYFSVTVDDLLSGDEVLTIAEDEYERKRAQMCDVVFGFLNLSVALFLFLPWFGQTLDGQLQEVSLLSLHTAAPYLKYLYLDVVSSVVLTGVLTLVLPGSRFAFWHKHKHRISLILNGVGTLLFILGSQPYAASFLFVLLVIQALLLIKKR